ncbi:MAG: hypothetical protein U9Q20_07945 [Campylobacterota bacterium]|nr:hypothetical protein [Campylobacterota bacterium]
MIETILIATNIVVVVVILIQTIVLIIDKSKSTALNTSLLEEKLISKEAISHSKKREQLHNKFLFSLSSSLAKTRECTQEVGDLKKNLSRIFKELSVLSTEQFVTESDMQEVIDFLDNDLNNYITNKDNLISSDKLFRIIERIREKNNTREE